MDLAMAASFCGIYGVVTYEEEEPGRVNPVECSAQSLDFGTGRPLLAIMDTRQMTFQLFCGFSFPVLSL